ncbi:MAG: FkbM family methyltransferase [Ramlibacter sp.]
MSEPDSDPILTRDCRHGRFSFPARDQYVGRALDLYGEWSEREVALVCSLTAPGSWVVEVGSNIGSHTVPIARHVGPSGRVVAFEPQRVIFQLLCANLVANRLFNVQALQAAGGRMPGSTLVPEIPIGTDYNFGAVRIGSAEGDEVPVVTIDSLALKRVDFIKIDAEDHEAAVLLGALDTLDRFSPPVLLEYNNHMRPIVNRVLRLLGWRCWYFDEPLFNPDNFRGRSDNLLGPYASLNLLLAKEPIPGITDDMAELPREELV